MQQLTQTPEEATNTHAPVSPPPASPAFEELVTSLATGAVQEQVDAARTLREFGPAAIEPLVQALRDKEVRVRLAAAKSLGAVGDERAVKPLVTALRELFPGASPRRYRTVGILAAITFPVAMLMYGWMRLSELGVPPAAMYSLIALLAVFSPKLYRIYVALTFQPAENSNPCRVFTEALARIAERCPAPELRAALPALNEIVADGLQQDRRTRADSRKVARRIEELTAQLDQLPVTASPPAPDVDSLPRV
jgi:HEAT repeat protein